MSFTYLVLNIFIIAIPLGLTFDERIAYHRRLPAIVFSIAVVSSFFLIWDGIVTARGEWSFNRRYLTGLQLLNIPLEEILFFITVPFSCLFIYEVVLYTTKSSDIKVPEWAVIGAIMTLFAASLALRHQGYTSKALAACGVFLVAAWLFDRSLLNSKQYWVWLGVCYIPFLIFNTVLTALPVVEYNPYAIFGFRVFTIPIEDFLYNFALLSFYIFLYRVRRNPRAGC